MQWADAFNARDLDGMLACLATHVEFHPLRLGGLSGCYHGHDGVREWFVNLRRAHQDHMIVLHDTQDVGGGLILGTGCLHMHGEADVGSFCAMNRIEAGVIRSAHHYLSDVDMIERLGLIP